jgi:hypothetical protein
MSFLLRLVFGPTVATDRSHDDVGRQRALARRRLVTIGHGAVNRRQPPTAACFALALDHVPVAAVAKATTAAR